MLNTSQGDASDRALLLQNNHTSDQAVRAQGIEDDDTDTSFVDNVEKGYNRFRQGLFALIADITGKEVGIGSFPAWLAFAQDAVMVLQYMHFAFYKAIDIEWSTSTASVVSWTLNAVSKYPSPQSDRSIELYIAYAVPAAYLVFGLITYALHRSLKWSHLIPIFGYLMLLVPGVLFIPTMTAHMKLFFGCFAYRPSQEIPNPFFNDITCWGNIHIITSVLSIIIITLWMFASFVVIVGWCSYDIPASLNFRDPTAASTRSVEWMDRWTITILLTLFAGVHNSAGRYPLSIIMCCAGLFITIMNVKYLPYYIDEMQSMVVFRSLSLTFCGFVSFLATILGSSDDSTAVLLFAAWPLFLIMAILIVRARYASIESLGTHELTQPYLFELRSRCILRRWQQTERSENSTGYLEDTPERLARRKVAYETAEKLLQEGVNRFPNSAQLNVWLGLFYVCVYDNGVLGYGALQAAAGNHPGFDMRFLLYLYKRTLDAQISATQSAEVRSYIEFKNRKELAEAAVVEAARRLVDFWSHLLRTLPDVDLLANQGHLARQAMQLASNHYDKLLTINPNSIPILRSYGTFALDILGDVSKSAMLYERAEEVEHNRISSVSDSTKKGEFLQILETNLDIFDERNGVIGITVERASLGIMESVNPSARRMLGYSQVTDMVGKNVSMACPEPIESHHDRFLTDFIMRKTGRIINQTRMTFAYHRAGHILPVNLYVRWSDAANGKILGVIQEVPLVHDCHMMVDPKTSIVTYITSNCYGIFGILRRQLISRELRLPDVLPALFDPEDADRTERNWDQLSSRAGLETDGLHLINRSPIRLHAWAMRVAVHEDEILFVRFLILDRTKRSSMADSVENFDDGSQSEGLEDDDAGHLDADEKRNKTAGERLRKYKADATSLAKKSQDGKKLLAGPGSETVEEAFARRRRRKRDEGQIEIQAAPGETESMAASSTAGGANRAYNHKRLSKAIHNVNRWTSKRLERMTYSMLAVVLILIACALTYHFVTELYLNAALDHYMMAYYSGVCSLSASRIAFHVRTLSLLSVESRDLIIHGASATTTIPDYVATSTMLISDDLADSHWAMTKLSDLAEKSSMNMMDKSRENIYLHEVIELHLAFGGIERTDRVGMEELILRFNGAALRVAFGAQRNLARFVGYFTTPSIDPRQTVIPNSEDMDPNLLDWDSPVANYLVGANGIRIVPEAFLTDTSLIAQEGLDYAALIPTVGIIVMCVCVAVNILILFIFMRPSIVMIKESKAQVLAMFLDIPKNIRRTIRRRVYGVYQMMRAEDEGTGDDNGDQIDNMGDEHDDQRELHEGVAGTLKEGEEEVGENAMQSFAHPDRANSQRDVTSWMAQRRAVAQRALKGDGSDIDSSSKKSDGKPRSVKSNVINLDSLTAAARTDANRNKVAGSDLEAAVSGSGDLSKLDSAALAKAKAEVAEKEDLANQNDKSWTILVLKFGFVLAVVIAGFLILTIKSSEEIDKTRHIGKIAQLALRRNKAIYEAQFLFREHLFVNYDHNQANNILLPTMKLGNYRAETIKAVEEINALQHAILFGSADYGVASPDADKAQQSMQFGNVCDIQDIHDQASKLERMPIPSDFKAECLATETGLFTKGLHGAILQYGFAISNVASADTAAILAEFTGQPPNPNHAHSSPLGELAKTQYKSSESMLEIFKHTLPRSAALYFVQTRSYLKDSVPLRNGILIGICLFVVLAYFALFLPTIHMLNTDARNTRAMMLVLPPDVVKSIPSVQLFIMENFQRRD